MAVGKGNVEIKGSSKYNHNANKIDQKSVSNIAAEKASKKVIKKLKYIIFGQLFLNLLFASYVIIDIIYDF